MVRIVKHIGNYEKSTLKLDDYEKIPSFGANFKRLINASLESFDTKPDTAPFKIENELFKVTYTLFQTFKILNLVFLDNRRWLCTIGL